MNNQPKLTTVPHTPTLQWHGGTDGTLEMIDQTRLPTELVPLMCGNVETVWEAIRSLRVRGAPAIGIAAAYGVCLGLQTVKGQGADAFYTRLREVVDYLASSRPTAVNLFWALDRMKRKAESLADQLEPPKIADALLCEAQAIEREDQQMCRAIGIPFLYHRDQLHLRQVRDHPRCRPAVPVEPHGQTLNCVTPNPFQKLFLRVLRTLRFVSNFQGNAIYYFWRFREGSSRV